MRQSEHVLYITLIDFLLQLLFLGLVLAVIYSALQPSEEEVNESKKLIPVVEQIKKSTGISDLTILTDALTRLGPLQDATLDAKRGKDFKDVVNKLGGDEQALKLLNAEANKGVGIKSCLPNQEKLTSFDTYRDHIEHHGSNSSEFMSVLKKLNIPESKVEYMTLDEFKAIFGSIKKITDDCMYYVSLIEHSYDTRPRDVFRGIFLTSPQRASDIK